MHLRQLVAHVFLSLVDWLVPITWLSAEVGGHGQELYGHRCPRPRHEHGRGHGHTIDFFYQLGTESKTMDEKFWAKMTLFVTNIPYLTYHMLHII